MVAPIGFHQYTPVLQTVEAEEQLYTVSYIRQYENANLIMTNTGIRVRVARLGMKATSLWCHHPYQMTSKDSTSFLQNIMMFLKKNQQDILTLCIVRGKFVEKMDTSTGPVYPFSRLSK